MKITRIAFFATVLVGTTAPVAKLSAGATFSWADGDQFSFVVGDSVAPAWDYAAPHGDRDRGGLRGKVHAAMVVLRRGGR
jgi:hypothetical protein